MLPPGFSLREARWVVTSSPEWEAQGPAGQSAGRGGAAPGGAPGQPQTAHLERCFLTAVSSCRVGRPTYRAEHSNLQSALSPRGGGREVEPPSAPGHVLLLFLPVLIPVCIPQ